MGAFQIITDVIIIIIIPVDSIDIESCLIYNKNHSSTHAIAIGVGKESVVNRDYGYISDFEN